MVFAVSVAFGSCSCMLAKLKWNRRGVV